MNNRRKLSRVLSLLLVFALFIGVLALPTQSAFAVPDENMPIDLGEVGAGVFAHITGGRTKPLTLTVYMDYERPLEDQEGERNGVMYWLSPDEDHPWHDYRNSIEKIVVGDGVTYISVFGFCEMPKVTEVHLPGTLIGVGAYAFSETAPKLVYYDGTIKQYYDTVDYKINFKHSGEGNDTLLDKNIKIICSQKTVLGNLVFDLAEKDVNLTQKYGNKDGDILQMLHQLAATDGRIGHTTDGRFDLDKDGTWDIEVYFNYDDEDMHLVKLGTCSLTKQMDLEISKAALDAAGLNEYYEVITFIPANVTLAGWQWIGKKWYHYSPTTQTPQKGWQNINGTWYYFDKASGVMQHGWVKDGDAWYFLGYPGQVNSGAMQKGWIEVNGYWYYLSSSGAMLKGWQTINGKVYYLKSSGAMAAREYVNGWWLNANGTWTYPYQASWKYGSKGWWYGDTSGWYARSATYIINDKAYTFDASGWWIEE